MINLSLQTLYSHKPAAICSHERLHKACLLLVFSPNARSPFKTPQFTLKMISEGHWDFAKCILETFANLLSTNYVIFERPLKKTRHEK